MAAVTMKALLEAGVHFGHQTRRWNPKMAPYIFTERNGIHILDLQRTLRLLSEAYAFARDVTAEGGTVLFVGTKKQAQEAIEREAARAGMPYVNQRWLGGMLTNWVTIRKRVGRLQELEDMRENGAYDALPKKEVLKLEAERHKLERNLAGIREMKDLPKAVFVVDTKKETIAVAEARRLRIPLLAIVDTNSDPDEIDHLIPGNDDAIRSINLMCRAIADAVLEGRAMLEGPDVLVEAPEEELAAEMTSAAETADAEPATEAPADEAPAEGAPAPAEAETSEEPASEPAKGDEPATDAQAEPAPEETSEDAEAQDAPLDADAAAEEPETVAEEPA